MDTHKVVILEIDQDDQHFSYLASIDDALSQANLQVEMLQETIDSVNHLRPQCDKLDYILSACSGALCGVIDIFLVGKPGESPIGNITDKWFDNRVCDFAKICGWKGSKSGKDATSSAIGFLERHFGVPYDQRGAGDAGSMIYDLNPRNHHFKSLGHNPSLLGLFFSILDQFTNSSHFVSEGRLLELTDASKGFNLRGKTIPGKIWFGFVNWFAHLMSDVAGSSGGNTRGMGIPSPLWTWTNDVIALKAMLGIPVNEFDKDVNELALNLYEKGFDFRFQTAQCIPVFINELIVRFFYSIRRLMKYYETTAKEERSFKKLWSACEPFTNPTVKRMLTVAHGTFCVVDAGDAVVRAFATGEGNFNALEFFLRLNVAGVGRFTICLYGEAKLAFHIHEAEKEAEFAHKQKRLTEYYIEGLKTLQVIYDDAEYLTFIDDLKNNDPIKGFSKTATLAQKRGVPDRQVLKSKEDIDNYFKLR